MRGVSVALSDLSRARFCASLKTALGVGCPLARRRRRSAQNGRGTRMSSQHNQGVVLTHFTRPSILPVIRADDTSTTLDRGAGETKKKKACWEEARHRARPGRAPRRPMPALRRPNGPHACASGHASTSTRYGWFVGWTDAEKRAHQGGAKPSPSPSHAPARLSASPQQSNEAASMPLSLQPPCQNIRQGKVSRSSARRSRTSRRPTAGGP
jgi:hypothetical protein